MLTTLYVDGQLITGSPEKFVSTLKTEFCTLFEIENCGVTRLCLGVIITGDR